MRFDTASFIELVERRGLSLGVPLAVFDVTGSTNDDAMAAARDGAPHGATFVAEQQTAGRGRRGQRWIAPAESDLTFSVLLRPRLAPERAIAFTLTVGLAVRDALTPRSPVALQIKWPNDIVTSGRKLAGILVESTLQGGTLAALVVGVGLNVKTVEFGPELEDTATSLALLGAADAHLAREPLLADLLERLERRLALYEHSSLSGMLDELKACDALRGTRVAIDGVAGIARGIDESGALLVELAPGNVRRIVSGSVAGL